MIALSTSSALDQRCTTGQRHHHVGRNVVGPQRQQRLGGLTGLPVRAPPIAKPSPDGPTEEPIIF